MRITTTNICGSDLHMYEGRTDVEQGKVLGHENMGIVEAVGEAVGRIQVGDRVSLPFNIVIYGAGPVGLMAAHAAQIKGAAQVFVVDQQPDRLKLAEQVGATPIDRRSGDAVEKITELTGGGADRGVDAVGYQAHNVDGTEHPEIVLNELIQAVKPTGGIGVVGVYVPEDPGARTTWPRKGSWCSTTARSSSRASRWGRGSATPSSTTRSSVT